MNYDIINNRECAMKENENGVYECTYCGVQYFDTEAYRFDVCPHCLAAVTKVIDFDPDL